MTKLTTNPYPVAFYFAVEFKKGSFSIELPFQEVSGLTVEIDTEEIREGGENSFTYHVPTRIKHSNLVLKRALAPIKGDYLEGLTGRAMNGDPISALNLFEITVSLMDANSDPLRSWLISNAYAVKWEVEPFGSSKNELSFEKLEFVYSKLQRKL